VLSSASFEEKSSHLKVWEAEAASWGRHSLGQSMLRSEEEGGAKLTVLCLSYSQTTGCQGGASRSSRGGRQVKPCPWEASGV